MEKNGAVEGHGCCDYYNDNDNVLHEIAIMQFMRAFWTRMRNNDCVSSAAWAVAYVALYCMHRNTLRTVHSEYGQRGQQHSLLLNEWDRGEAVLNFSGVATKRRITLCIQ